MKHLLFVDFGAGGHHVEYLVYIYRSLRLSGILNFSLLTALANKNHILREGIADLSKNFIFYDTSKSGLIGQWWIVLKTVVVCRYRAVYLLDLNQFQPIVPLLPDNLVISGLYFRPYIRSVSVRARTNFRLLLRKYLLSWVVNFTPSLRSIHVLMDSWSVKNLNLIHRTDKFLILADPLPTFLQIQNCASTKSSKRKTLLFLGEISRRKGIDLLFEALSVISSELHSLIAIRIVGRLNKVSNAEWITMRYNLKQKCPDLLFEEKFGFFSSSEIYHEFLRCDVIVAPYRETSGSSGILGWASIARKPIVTSKEGLIGELAKKYQLGPTVNCHNKYELAAAVMAALYNDWSNANHDAQLQERDWQKFAKTIVESVVCDKYSVL